MKFRHQTDVTVKVDVHMLREQRDTLINVIAKEIGREDQADSLECIVNLLDAMLDDAEGF